MRYAAREAGMYKIEYLPSFEYLSHAIIEKPDIVYCLSREMLFSIQLKKPQKLLRYIGC